MSKMGAIAQGAEDRVVIEVLMPLRDDGTYHTEDRRNLDEDRIRATVRLMLNLGWLPPGYVHE